MQPVELTEWVYMQRLSCTRSPGVLQ